MIKPGTLCYIIGKGVMHGWPNKRGVVPMPGRICEIVADHDPDHVCVDEPCNHVCIIKFPSGVTCCMFTWRDLRPIAPPSAASSEPRHTKRLRKMGAHVAIADAAQRARDEASTL